jgi:hypothetical protein
MRDDIANFFLSSLSSDTEILPSLFLRPELAESYTVIDTKSQLVGDPLTFGRPGNRYGKHLALLCQRFGSFDLLWSTYLCTLSR